MRIAVLCVVVTKYKPLVIAPPFVILASRAAIAAALGVHRIESLIITVIAGALLFILARITGDKYRELQIPEGYSLREIGMDILVMGPILLIIYFLYKLV